MAEPGVLKDIGIDDLMEPTEQARTVITLEGLQDLSDSIKQAGIIEPLVVVKKGDKYEVVAGHRRFLAAKMAGLVAAPCIVREIESKDSDFIKLHENFFREAVNPVDEARFFNRLHEKYNLSCIEIAQRCCRSVSYVQNRVNLLGLDERVLAALEGGVIGFSQAVIIGGCVDEKVRGELLRVTVENGATVQSLRIMRGEYESRLNAGDGSLKYEPPVPGHYESIKHLICCPVCRENVDITQIFPLSVCNKCHDDMIKRLKEDEDGKDQH